MAGTQITTDLSELEGQRYGANLISFDDWTDGAEPVISGYLEDNGGLYFFNAEDIDNAAAWGGIANSTLVYLYINPATIVPYLSTTAPAWDETKNGYYLAASPTHRCYGQIYKDGAGNYDQKTIVMSKGHGVTNVGVNLGIGANADRDIILASDAKISWDEANDYIEADKPIDNTNINTYATKAGAAELQIAQLVTGGVGGSADFQILKPCILQVETNIAGPNTGGLYLKNSYGFKEWVTTSSGAVGGPSNVLPGTYRLYNEAAGTTTLYAVSVYGANNITTASDITDA